MSKDENRKPIEIDRRDFIKYSSLAVAASTTTSGQLWSQDGKVFAQHLTLNFDEADSLFHGKGWETLNPGYWQIKNKALRRRFDHYGDRARATGFPYHYETHRRNGGKMPVDYDPSLPYGIIYRRDWKLAGAYTLSAKFTYKGTVDKKREGDSENWKMFQNGYSRLGIAIGAKCLFESYNRVRNASLCTLGDHEKFEFHFKQVRGKKKVKPVVGKGCKLQSGDSVEIQIKVNPTSNNESKIVSILKKGDETISQLEQTLPRTLTEGYFGLVGRGLMDFQVDQIKITPEKNELLSVGEVDCLTCYPLGDTLKKKDGRWKVKFIALFASDGKETQIRISDSENPEGGWNRVPIAGTAKIVNNRWRRNTSVVEVTLPFDPSEKEQFFCVYKDGINVTADTRIGSQGTGPGTGFVGDVPSSGSYVGRLPQLTAPYKLCGLSCHAITSGLQHRTETGFRMLGGGNEWMFRDQPTVEAYKHFEDYNFQILCWEDDVWYLELVFYPPSTDDAYKVIATTIAGPTSRWQMMRHWNIINPGDHDYGMDDVKGPEQIAIRLKDGLGQDKDYMRRNFQIVHHLITGEEEVDPLANPKKWRAWKMPNRDFSLVIVDSRLWRSSQDTAMWDDEGWGHIRELYDRADPTRTLLGEEQFAWLQELIKTDASDLICLTGLNGLHTIWTGGNRYSHTDQPFAQRDRVAADYAGWVAAGTSRVIELLGSRDGVVSVYGDVHNGCIMKNTHHGLIECSFGPIGRSGGRSVIPGFGPKMKDFDERPLEVYALYHGKHANPELKNHKKNQPTYWNFLEMEFHPQRKESQIQMRVRNMIDSPKETPRGGGELKTEVSKTGRQPNSRLPKIKTLPNADVRVVTVNGRPVRGVRSGPNGEVENLSLIDIPPQTKVIVTAYDGEKVESKVVHTV